MSEVVVKQGRFRMTNVKVTPDKEIRCRTNLNEGMTYDGSGGNLVTTPLSVSGRAIS